MGYSNSTDGKDVTEKGQTSYDPDEFERVFRFKPPFARSAVKKVILR